PLAPESALALTAPMHTKVMGSPTTVAYLVGESRLPSAALSGAFRKQLRPRGPIVARAFAGNASGAVYRNAVAQLNAGELSAAPTRAQPTGPTLDRFA